MLKFNIIQFALKDAKYTRQYFFAGNIFKFQNLVRNNIGDLKKVSLLKCLSVWDSLHATCFKETEGGFLMLILRWKGVWETLPGEWAKEIDLTNNQNMKKYCRSNFHFNWNIRTKAK